MILKNIKCKIRKNKTVEFLNMTLSNLTNKEKEDLKIKSGLRILDSGEFLEGQIENNSILIDINGNVVDAVDQILQMDPNSVRWITYINPNGEKFDYVFNLQLYENRYIITFPKTIKSSLEYSIIKKALNNNLISINYHDIRDHSKNKQKKLTTTNMEVEAVWFL